jgi:hypothetical protein
MYGTSDRWSKAVLEVIRVLRLYVQPLLGE